MMNEKLELEEFDEDEEEVVFEVMSEVDFDCFVKDFDVVKKCGQKLGDFVWCWFECCVEEKYMKEFISDFDDYDIDDDSIVVCKMNMLKVQFFCFLVF